MWSSLLSLPPLTTNPPTLLLVLCLLPSDQNLFCNPLLILLKNSKLFDFLIKLCCPRSFRENVNLTFELIWFVFLLSYISSCSFGCLDVLCSNFRLVSWNRGLVMWDVSSIHDIKGDMLMFQLVSCTHVKHLVFLGQCNQLKTLLTMHAAMSRPVS